MTVVTLTNSQNVQKLPQTSWFIDAIEEQRSFAQDKLNQSIADAKIKAAGAKAEAEAYAKRQAQHAALQIALFVPIALIVLACLIGSQANLMVMARLLPGALLAFVGYVVFSIVNSPRFRSEP